MHESSSPERYSERSHTLSAQPRVRISAGRSSAEAVWSQYPVTPYAIPSLIDDPALRAPSFIHNAPQNNIQPVSTPALLANNFPHPDSAAHHPPCPQAMQPFDPRMDAQMRQRMHHEYNSAVNSAHALDPQLVYHLVSAEQTGQPIIGWSARDTLFSSGPTPRQRSAKACQKCRERKTKCSGTEPCTRCVRRGLACVYDTAATRRGRRKSRTDIRSDASTPETTAADSPVAESPHHPMKMVGDAEPPANAPYYDSEGPLEGRPTPTSSPDAPLRDIDEAAQTSPFEPSRDESWPAVGAGAADAPGPASVRSVHSQRPCGSTLFCDVSFTTTADACPDTPAGCATARRTPASSISSSSLKDALVQQPRRRISQALLLCAPSPVAIVPDCDPSHAVRPDSEEPASSLAETAGCTLPTRPAIGESPRGGPPPDWTRAQHAVGADALRLEDVLDHFGTSRRV